MKPVKNVVCIALVASVSGNLGCSAPGPEETFSEVRQAVTVASWDDLVNMPSTGSHTLTANINASGKTWTPKAFSGTLDGGNRTISNLTIDGGSFFSSLTNATIRNLRFTNLTLTGGSTEGTGGLAKISENSSIQNCAVEANINVSATMVGGLVGTMNGGSIFRSYAKGTIQGSMFYAGGLVGIANASSVGPAQIYESYAQVTVNPNTPTGIPVVAGGLVGYGNGPVIYDVYAVGNVTGRGAVGGIIGDVTCTVGESAFQLYKTIYRGNVVDRDKSSTSGGWSGGVGTFTSNDCAARFVQNFYDRSLDDSTSRAPHASIRGYTTYELRSPTSVTGGVFCEPDVVFGRCGDNTWQSPPWTAGTNMQHHVLLNMPGPNVQPR